MVPDANWILAVLVLHFLREVGLRGARGGDEGFQLVGAAACAAVDASNKSERSDFLNMFQT